MIRKSLFLLLFGIVLGWVMARQGLVGKKSISNFPNCFTEYRETTSSGLSIQISGRLRPMGNTFDDSACVKVEFRSFVGEPPNLHMVSVEPLGKDSPLLWIGPLVNYEVAEVTKSIIRTKPLVGVDRTLTIDREHGQLVIQEVNGLGDEKGILSFKVDGKEQVLVD